MKALSILSVCLIILFSSRSTVLIRHRISFDPTVDKFQLSVIRQIASNKWMGMGLQHNDF